MVEADVSADEAAAPASKAWQKWLPVYLILLAQFVQGVIAAFTSVHHYDFTYFHDFLARSVAHNGQLDTPYLEKIGYGGWFLTVYGLTVLVDAAEHAVGSSFRAAWYIYSLFLPALVVWLVARRASVTGACMVAILLAAFFPATILDIRPHWVVAFLLAAGSVVVATSKHETRMSDVLLLSLFTVLAVLTKREAFVLFFVPCAVMLVLLIYERRWREIAMLVSLAGAPVICILVYRLIFGASGGGFRVGDGSNMLADSSLWSALVSLFTAVSQNYGQMLIAVLCGVASILFAGKRWPLLAWLFIGQIAVFVAFDFALQAGPYNASTILRKAYYPLAVGMALIGTVAMPRQVKIGRHWFLAAVVTAVVTVVAAVAVRVPGMIWHGNYNLDREREFQQLPVAWAPIIAKMAPDEPILVSGANGFNFPLYRGNPYFPQGLAAAVFPKEVRVVDGAIRGAKVFIPGPDEARPLTTD